MNFYGYTKIGLLVFSFALLSGCSSCGEAESGNANVANSGNVEVVTPKKAINGAPAPDNSNAKMVPYPGLANGENPTLDESKVKVIDMSKVKPQPMKPKVMPDSSEILTVQSPDGKAFIETRTFKNNKQLVKLERTSKSASDRVVKVYLANGKVITVANDKIKDFATDTAAAILTAAGVKPDSPAPVSQSESREKTAKPKQ